MKHPDQLEFELIGRAAERVVRDTRRHSDLYRLHLASPEWRSQRHRLFHQNGYRCQRCGCRPDLLQLHHKNYRTLGMERDSDLEVLCIKCHVEADKERRLIWD